MGPGASRASRSSAREAAAPAYSAPGPGEAVVLGRARRGLRGGVLCATAEALVWVKGAGPDIGRPGTRVALGGLEASGHAPALLVAYADLVSYRSVAGVFGEGALTLRASDGRATKLRLRDPEVFVLLGEAVGDRDAD